MEMCPARERTCREKQGRLHPYEVLQESSSKQKPIADIKSTVKEFSRPAAGRHIEVDELRPASVLVKTMDFLLKDILAKSSPWHFKCEFVSDRIRAIRQDLTVQGIVNKEAVDVLEKATRYYIVTGVKLSQEPVENFDRVLHNSHTQQCLKKLLFLYEFDFSETYPNRPSFEACYLLYNLGNPQAYYHTFQLQERLRKTKIMQLAISLTKAYLNGNFVGLFRILMQLPFLESCAFFFHIEPLRCKALEVMNIAYSSKNLSYPLSSLTDIFHFDTEDIAAEFCCTHGIRVTAGKVFFSKGQFVKPDKSKLQPCCKLIESKLMGDITDVLLFHKQRFWDKISNDTTNQSVCFFDNKIDLQKIAGLTAETKAINMLGVKQKELVTPQRGQARGRGRAKKKM